LVYTAIRKEMTNIFLNYIGSQVSVYILGQAKRFIKRYIETDGNDAVREMQIFNNFECNFQEFFMENDNENFEKEIELESLTVCFETKKTKDFEESWEFIN
jgi:hypothetical protein